MNTILQIINESEKILLIEYNSGEYESAVDLRHDILRKPLGLVFTPQQLSEEKHNYHLAYYNDNILIAYLMLVPENDGRIKMKQVAVANTWQGKGVGSKLVLAAETFSKAKGFTVLYCHARDKAVPFYEKLNYNRVGDMFREVTIPHYQMDKELT
ncbi:MAG: GNAT family N-acetyltransferase [Fimbriimonadaceae bacterium]|nr:GNAT family N-acetyltransferase [Chitinophagales bacterium]